MTSNMIFDQVIEQIQPELELLAPDLGKFTELRVIDRGYPKNPLTILADENGDEWVFRMRWNFEDAKRKWLNILLLELLVTEIGADLDLRISRYYPYRYEVTSPHDGSRQVRWGNITRYFTDCIPFVFTASALQVQCLEQYLADIVRVLVYSWWVGDTDDTGENWLRHKESNEPLRIDFANVICHVRSKPNAAYVQWLIARDGLRDKYFDVIKHSYESMVDIIHEIPLSRYLDTPVFSVLSDGQMGIYDYNSRLRESWELLHSRKTFETFIGWMHKDAWPSLR